MKTVKRLLGRVKRAGLRLLGKKPRTNTTETKITFA